MAETIKSLLTEELNKLSPQDRDSLTQEDIETFVENRLSGMGIRILVPKKEEGRGAIDLNKPIEEVHVNEVRKYIARYIREKLDGFL